MFLNQQSEARSPLTLEGVLNNVTQGLQGRFLTTGVPGHEQARIIASVQNFAIGAYKHGEETASAIMRKASQDYVLAQFLLEIAVNETLEKAQLDAQACASTNPTASQSVYVRRILLTLPYLAETWFLNGAEHTFAEKGNSKLADMAKGYRAQVAREARR